MNVIGCVLSQTCVIDSCLAPPPLVYDKQDTPLSAEDEEQRAVAKIKMLGNIKFIGELGKLDLIHESILHKCIKTVCVCVSPMGVSLPARLYTNQLKT